MCMEDQDFDHLAVGSKDGISVGDHRGGEKKRSLAVSRLLHLGRHSSHGRQKEGERNSGRRKKFGWHFSPLRPEVFAAFYHSCIAEQVPSLL